MAVGHPLRRTPLWRVLRGLNLIESDLLDSMKNQVENSLQNLIQEQLEMGSGEVAELCSEILLAGGKRFRPLLILLAYGTCGGRDFDEVMPLACAFELIHTATLVHDDIYDGADQRRGVATIHKKAGLAKGVIAGDWLFTMGFGLGGRYSEEIVEIMSKCCADIAVAEFQQFDHINDLATTPDDYFQIVEGKTAGPFAAGCKAAALIAGCDAEQAEKMYEFGLQLGIAFQLVDDLLDLYGDDRLGKPRGVDVYEGKMTLPIIHALTLLHGEKRDQLSEILSDFGDEKFTQLIDLLTHSKSIEYAKILASTYLERSEFALEVFEQSEYKELMLGIAELVNSRNS